MNRQIVKLFAFIVVLFGVLVGFTSYWSVFDAQALKEKQVNKRPLFEAQQIRRGRILAADGTVIAKSTAVGQGANRRFVRHYPLKIAVRPPDRLQLRRIRELRVRAVPQRRTGRRKLRIRIDPRPDHRQEAGRQRHRHQHRPRSAEGGVERARKHRLRGRGGDQAEHRRSQGDDLERALQPQPVPDRKRKAEQQHRRNPALRSRHPGAEAAGLDLQGRDRGRRPAVGSDHPRIDDRRAGGARSGRQRTRTTTSTRTSARSRSTPR